MSDSVLVPGGPHVRAAVDRHLDRFDALRWLWRRSRLDAVRSCRRAGMTTRGGKVVSHHSVERRPDHSIHVTGLRTCGSVWACPCCSSLIARRRAEDIQTAVETALAGGWSVAFLTVTLSHDKRHSLESSWDALTSAWSRSVQGPAWRHAQEFAGVTMPSFKDPSVTQSRIPAIRSMESTITEAGGWHPHLHVLLFTRRGETRDETEAIQRRVVSGGPASRGIVGRFRAQLAKSGRRLADQGWNLQHIHDESDVRAVMGDYIAKTFYDSLGLELGSAATKRGWGGSMTPFELLAKLASGERGTGYYAARRLWVEWEQTSKGRRQIVWSRNLRLALGMGDEPDDLEISEERWGLLPGAISLSDNRAILSGLQGPNEQLCWMTTATWRSMAESGVWSAALSRAIDDPSGLVSLVIEWGRAPSSAGVWVEGVMHGPSVPSDWIRRERGVILRT